MRIINKRNFPFAPKKTGDVGYDLYVDIFGIKQTRIDKLASRFLKERVIIILPFTNRALASGIFLALPSQIWAKIEARSSSSKRGLTMAGGIIDSGYRGEMFAVMHNGGLVPRIIRDGERYAQAIFHGANRPSTEQVEQFYDQTVRGDTGFGSSGK